MKPFDDANFAIAVTDGTVRLWYASAAGRHESASTQRSLRTVTLTETSRRSSKATKTSSAHWHSCACRTRLAASRTLTSTRVRARRCAAAAAVTTATSSASATMATCVYGLAANRSHLCGTAATACCSASAQRNVAAGVARSVFLHAANRNAVNARALVQPAASAAAMVAAQAMQWPRSAKMECCASGVCRSVMMGAKISSCRPTAGASVRCCGARARARAAPSPS